MAPIPDNPRLSPQVVIDPAHDERRIVHKPATNEYFRFGLREAAFLESLDGTRTVASMTGAGDCGFNPEEVAFLLERFSEMRLLAGQEAAAEARALPWWRRLSGFVTNTQKWRMKLASPDAFLDRHRGLVDAMFSVPALAVYLGIVFIPALLFLADPEQVRLALGRFDPNLSTTGWVLLYVGLLITNVLHEFAHAAACKHYGGRVERIGIMLMYLQPVLYCDVSDSWRFREVQHKVVVAAAGLVLQVVLAALATSLWVFWGDSTLIAFAVANVGLVLLNLIPFVKLDGYWILVHLLGEPNLRQKGLDAIDAGLRRLLRRQDDRASKPAVIAFALGHIMVVPAFWLLGLSTLYRYACRVSIPLAWAMVAIFGLPLTARALRFAAGWLRATLSEPAVAR